MLSRQSSLKILRMCSLCLQISLIHKKCTYNALSEKDHIFSNWEVKIQESIGSIRSSQILNGKHTVYLWWIIHMRNCQEIIQTQIWSQVVETKMKKTTHTLGVQLKSSLSIVMGIPSSTSGISSQKTNGPSAKASLTTKEEMSMPSSLMCIDQTLAIKINRLCTSNLTELSQTAILFRLLIQAQLMVSWMDTSMFSMINSTGLKILKQCPKLLLTNYKEKAKLKFTDLTHTQETIVFSHTCTNIKTWPWDSTKWIFNLKRKTKFLKAWECTK